MPSLPLDQIRVLDLSGEIGSYGTKVLADFGADVVKVEPAGGDRQRARPPFARGEAGLETSLIFAYYNANKRGVEIDLADPNCTTALSKLAVGQDLVVIANSPALPIPGWDPIARSLSWADPGSIVCSLSAFGTGGPHDSRRSTHLTSFATSGQMLALGPEEGPPRCIPGTVLYDEFSAHAATAMMVALRERKAIGPQAVELSLHDMLAFRDTVGFDIYARAKISLFTRKVTPIGPPSRSWEVKDGWIEFLTYNPPHWDGFIKMLGYPPELDDPALRDRSVRAQRSDELTPIIARLLAHREIEELVDLAQECRVPTAPQYTPHQLIRDRQLEARGFWVTQDGPGTGPFTVPGLPFIASKPLLQQHRRPAPLLGQHNAELLDVAVQTVRPPTELPAGPRIAELKILSFGTAIAGNVSAMMLAELGADVVKIESPLRPDPLRAGPIAQLPRVFEPSGVETTSMFASYSRSCRSAALDMKSPEDQEIFLKLVREADVLIDNFATGVMEGWGLSHQSLTEVNPKLIMVTVSGYGRTGPRSHYMAYGSTINSFMGMTRAWSQHGTQFDYTAVANVLPAVFAALANRDRTGDGCIVDIAQAEAGGVMLAPLYLPALNFDDPAMPIPNWVAGSLFSAVLRCAGEDRWLAVELENVTDWSIATALLDAPQLTLTDGDAPDEDARSQLHEILARWAIEQSPEQAERTLRQAGLAAAWVKDTADEYEDAQLWGRNGVATITHPDLGERCYPAPFQRFEKTPVHFRRPSARLGQHTAEVLAEWVGENNGKGEGCAGSR